MITSEPYSEPERLEILLRAIESAIVQRADLEHTVLDQLTEVAAVEFKPDVPRADADVAILGRAHRLDIKPCEFGGRDGMEAKAALAALEA